MDDTYGFYEDFDYKCPKPKRKYTMKVKVVEEKITIIPMPEPITIKMSENMNNLFNKLLELKEFVYEKTLESNPEDPIGSFSMDVYDRLDAIIKEKR